jgi:hypothetical protein
MIANWQRCCNQTESSSDAGTVHTRAVGGAFRRNEVEPLERGISSESCFGMICWTHPTHTPVINVTHARA